MKSYKIKILKKLEFLKKVANMFAKSGTNIKIMPAKSGNDIKSMPAKSGSNY